MTRDEFVTTVRSYLGTKFHHQGRLPGVGLDCAGVPVCALQENNYPVTDVQGYGRVPSQGTFTQAILEHCDPITITEVQIGDLLMFAFRTDPQHIAVVSDLNPLMMIHAHSDVGKVVENGMDKTWQDRLRGCYKLKGIL